MDTEQHRLDDCYKRTRCGKYGDDAEEVSASSRKVEGKIQDNYDKYLKEPHRMGFDPYPTKEVIDTMTIDLKCRRDSYQVPVTVSLVKGIFKSSGEDILLNAIVTSQVDIASRLPLHGFNSNCCFDEAETMEQAVVLMAKKHNLMICTKKVSWPEAQAIVQENFYKD